MAEDRDVTEKISHLRALLRGDVKPSSPRFDFEIEALFGGLVGIQMEPGETHALAPGIAISATYAHCFSYFMAAFERPPAPGAPTRLRGSRCGVVALLTTSKRKFGSNQRRD